MENVKFQLGNVFLLALQALAEKGMTIIQLQVQIDKLIFHQFLWRIWLITREKILVLKA